MIQFETRRGSRVVITTANDESSLFTSRLYVNNGETSTLLTARAKTREGAKKQAIKLLKKGEL